MTLADIRNQIANRLADASGAVAKYTAIPEEPPQRLPCVITKWRTEPFIQRYGIFTDGATARRHTIEAWCVLSVRRDMPAEDASGMLLTDAIINEFDDDGTLNGLASGCVLQLVEPFIISYGDVQQGQAFYSLHSVFSVEETTA